MQKRILFFLSHTFYPETNAAASRMYERLKYMKDLDTYKIVVVTQGKKNSPLDLPKNIAVTYLSPFPFRGHSLLAKSSSFLWFGLRSFMHLLWRASKRDIIFASSPQFLVILVGYWIKKIKKSSFIAEIADLWPDTIAELGYLKKSSLFFKFWKKLELSIYKNANGVVALTPGIKERILKDIPSHPNLEVIPNGYDQTFWRKALPKTHKSEKLRVGYYGAIGRAQLVQDIVEVAKILEEQKCTRVEFQLAGRGANFKDVEKLIQNYQLKNISLEGEVSKTEMLSLWKETDVCLIPLKNIKLFEGVIPTKITECIGTETPILLVSPLSDASKVVTQYNFGRHIIPGENSNIASLLQSWSTNRTELENFSENMKQLKYKFTRENQAEKILEFITKTT